MTRFTPPRPRGRRRRDGEHGQMLVLFALCLTAIIAMAGLLIDGGMAWANKGQAQTAADTAALAAAKAIVNGTGSLAEAQIVAAANGFGAGTDCHGTALPGNGVTVNRPPTTGTHAGDSNYIEVVTTRRMTTTFSQAIGQGCWMVSARAVASIGTSSVAKCSFCSLNKSNKNHTLVLNNGATLRVDGDIYVNSTNGGTAATDCDDGKELHDWFACGDGFDVFGAGGSITARTIAVTGGWETHDKNPVKADALAPLSNGTPCPLHPDPPSQTAPYLPSNVCMHMPQIADPLNDATAPGNIIAVPPAVGAPVAGVNGCPAGARIPTGTSVSPSKLTITTAGVTICPGTYFGGLKISGSGSVTMMPGVYYMAGGGFTVVDSAAVNGSAGVMIYNSSGTIAESDSTIGVDLVPPKDKSKKDPSGVALSSDVGKNPAVGQTVVLTMNVDRNGGPTPTGLMTFFEGSTPISGCSNVTVVDAGGGHARGTCTTSWGTFGTKALSSVYYGDSFYNAVGRTLTLTIAEPAGSSIAPVTISTTGAVRLYGPTTGASRGLVIFQNRNSALTISLSPGPGSATACAGTWLTQDVPDIPGVDPPDACGALGGLRGTIYAANDAALVYITASGLANLQVLAGKIQVDSDADARFAFTPQYFANGNIRLVE